MAEKLEVDGRVVGSLSARLTAAGNKAEAARLKLLHGGDALGTPWGRDDELARKFSAEYLPGRDEVVKGTESVAGFLKGLGAHLRASGESFSSVEGS
ncbi:hypothetical protein ACIBTV_24600 [Micromonospora sp. NPDC049366]|uniref:hypothetical protein n=1 Tax=Micromonospora sp. NPDC049366 TaxID=3364271 RepID=UPI003788B1D4